MKNILIDLDRLKDINTGLGQVALFFGKEFAKINDNNIKFTFLVPENYKDFFGTNVDYEIVSLKRRWFPSICKKYDLWYALHQDSSYFPARKTTPYILTIHDLNFLSEKSEKKAQKRLKRLQKKIDRAVHITAISNFTKDDILKNLDVKNKEIQVIYNGVDILEFPHAKNPSFVSSGKILFSIGVIKEKKNTKVLIPFIEELPLDYKLVIAGNNSSSYAKEILNLIEQKGLGNRIVMPGQISDEDKFWLLNNCTAVLFPSRNEGMGLPPIEAMRFGKPVFASTYSSIPEISEDNAYYWQNFEPKYMSDFFLEKIANFNSNPTKPETLKKYSQKFNWKNNTEEYLKVFLKFL